MAKRPSPDRTAPLAPLIEGEKLDWAVEGQVSAKSFSDAEIDDKYVRGEVRIVTEQGRYPLNTVPQLARSTNYDLTPEFQRRHRWNRARQSRLIESFIMNVPVPPVFLYEDEYSHYEVMDGLQRLTAITEFYEDRFELEGLAEWPELNGRTYSRLPEQVKRGIDRRYLSSVVLLYETAKDTVEAERLKQLVFERINSGGEDLSAQETRNALYPGRLNALCIRLARNPALCRMWGIPDVQLAEDEPDVPQELKENSLFRKMEDVELVLRFFAHRQRRDLWKSGTRLDAYFTRYLRDGNSFPDDVLQRLAEIFTTTVELVYDTLEEKAFWLRRERQGRMVWVERPTVIAYDSIMYAFSRFRDQEATVRERKAQIRDALPRFYGEHYDEFDGRRTNATDIERRDRAMIEFLGEQLS